MLTEFMLDFSGVGVTAVADTTPIPIPPRGAAIFPVQVMVSAPGSYQLLGAATGAASSGSATATLTFVFDGENQPPEVDAGPDQTVSVNQLVQFSGSAVDPDEDEIVSIEWDFGDGITASGTLTPTHSYAEAGDYTVTLTVTDSRGGVGVDTLIVAVEWRLYLPLIVR
jgi:PKD repeat protein